MSQIRWIVTIALVFLLSGLAFAAPGEKPAPVIAPGQNDMDFQAAAGSLGSWCGAEVLAIVTAHGIGVESLVAGDFAAPESAQIRPTGASALEVSSEGFESRGGGVYRLGMRPVDGTWVTGQYQVGLRLDTGNGAKAEWTIVPITVSEIPSCFVQWRVEDGGNGHWYKLVLGLTSWDEASVGTQRLGGYLATITSAAESDFVEGIVSVPGNSYVAIGGRQDPAGPEPDGGWGWVTGESWEYTDWCPGQPENAGGDEDCLMIVDNMWHDVTCYHRALIGFVLEVDSR
jgi:hypothetical protein